ncbi:MAG: DUF5317 domain-containing protein [Chloroflexi bacterium]|nr:DUF5317 domain-containing protein [Chloroflexota bacterium]
MFLLYAVLAGLLIGAVTRGSATRLGDLRFAWTPLIVAGMMTQLLLFWTSLGDALGPWAVVLYVASNIAVLLAVGRNLAIPGLRVVLVGGASNLLAISANGGYMPANPEALAVLGHVPNDEYSNSSVVANAVLWPLTDLFAMPAWLPLANIFSVGDVLIGTGAAIAVVAAMHGHGPLEPRPADDVGSGQPA